MVKIENPLTKVRNSNKILKFYLFIMILALPVSYYYHEQNLQNYYNSKLLENTKLKNNEIIKDQKLLKMQEELKNNEIIKDQELLKMQEELKIKDDELKKLTLSKNNIKNFILEKNPNISLALADKYAIKILIESNKNGNSHNVQSALLASESHFISNPIHDIPTVLGMGGIYTNVWSDTLKKEGIINHNKDLLDPMVNIEASSYILSHYMKQSNSTLEALTRYKGYSKLGKKQAKAVLVVAIALKKQEKNSKKEHKA